MPVAADPLGPAHAFHSLVFRGGLPSRFTLMRVLPDCPVRQSTSQTPRAPSFRADGPKTFRTKRRDRTRAQARSASEGKACGYASLVLGACVSGLVREP